MKKLVKKLVKCCFIGIMITIVLFLLSIYDRTQIKNAEMLNSQDYILYITGTGQINPIIDSLRNNDGKTKLVLGDSVCWQMYNGLAGKNPDICFAGSNQAITMAGQYLLLKEFLAYHDDVTDVWLMMIPTSLAASLSPDLGYQYVVMPFVEKDMLQDLDVETVETIEKLYGRVNTTKEFVSIIDKSGIGRKLLLNHYRNSIRVNTKPFVSDLSEKYLPEMKHLCEERNISLHFLAGPMADTSEKRQYVNDFCQIYKESAIYDLYPDYAENVVFYPEDQFVDGVHFGGDAASEESFIEKTKDIFVGDSFLREVILEY